MGLIARLTLVVYLALAAYVALVPTVRAQEEVQATAVVVNEAAQASPTPEPTNTPTPKPTNTPTPEPTNTPTPEPTNTPTPEPTNTPKPAPTNTPKPEPTNTPRPEPTKTPRISPTATPTPARTTSHDEPGASESGATEAEAPTATPTPSPVAPLEANVLYRDQDGTRDRDGADLGRVRIGGGRRVLPGAASVTVQSETSWSLSVSTSGPLTNTDTGDIIPLQRFQWRLSGDTSWTPFRSGPVLVLGNQPPAPDSRRVVLDYSVIITRADTAGRYDTDLAYTVSAAP